MLKILTLLTFYNNSELCSTKLRGLAKLLPNQRCQKPPITDGWHVAKLSQQQVVFDAQNSTLTTHPR